MGLQALSQLNAVEQMKAIRSIWLDKSTDAFAHGSGLHEDLRGQLDQFYTLLAQSLETQNPACLDTILLTWAGSLTQSDLEGNNSSLIQFLNQIAQVTFQVFRESFSDSQGSDLFYTLTPGFYYAYDKAAQFELSAKISFISAKLEKAQQSLERIDRSKSDFISIAAHELKTPLTLIEGYASMLRDSCKRSPTMGQDLAFLDGIQKGTDRMQSIVNDMIDVSLIDNDLLKLNFQPVWMNRLLTGLQDELAPVIRERKQTLEIQDFPGSREMIFADPERLLQVFRNILLNAIKYTPDEGKIEVSGRILPGFVEMTVTDTGIGIAPGDQPYIFEKFSQIGKISLHSSGRTKFKGGGPGLGLKIARGIIEAHGGAIWVESPCCDDKNYPGSAFHVLLPQSSTPPDEKMAKIFAPILNLNKEIQEE
jgi:signal transduction histidine kinase